MPVRVHRLVASGRSAPAPATGRSDTRDPTLSFVEFIVSKTVLRARRLAASTQAFYCFYCSLPMWERDCTAHARRLGVPRAAAKLLRCTAEHLLPHADGGPDLPNNIAAACVFCNRMRHQLPTVLPPARYRVLVQHRVRVGTWFEGYPALAAWGKQFATNAAPSRAPSEAQPFARAD